MSSKRGNKNYYKGKGARPMGRSTKHGNYKIDAPAIAHAVYEEPDMAEPDEYWEPERLPTNRSKMQALVSDHCTAAILAPPPLPRCAPQLRPLSQDTSGISAALSRRRGRCA